VVSVEEALASARDRVKNSRSASEHAKTLLDSGYHPRLDRDRAVEELRQSVEQLIDIVESFVKEGVIH
jgi:20S proteasome alpha/beta subunit